MIDVVSVFCHRDLALQHLQARSIARHFERQGLGRLVLVWNDTREAPATLRADLADGLDGIAFDLLTAAELGVERSSIAVDGWTTQQALKLLAARRVATGRYLVLDAKNHLVRACAEHDFVAPDGRGILPMQELGGSESFQYCLAYFGVDPSHARRGALNTTPFVLETAVVEGLLAALSEKEARTTAETFLAQQHKLSEFLAYQAYVLSKGRRLSELFQEATANLGRVVWGSTALDAGEFERCMEALEQGGAKVAGLHWMACCIMSARQKARMCELWLDRGLVETAEQGQTIFASVTRGLGEGDRRYLNTYLRSAGARPSSPPDVSVIVPVYNKAPYLPECLASILCQSLWPLEVICVDDGSTDGSREILARFAERDARVTVIHHDRNRGAAAARNAGLALARGEFVQFTDADDLLTPDALRLLLDTARADEVDVVRGGIVGFHTSTPDAAEALDIPEARTRIRPLDHQMSWVPWWHSTYLYSRRFLLSHGISYPALCSGEDPVFLAEVLTRVPLISTICAVTYRYRLRPLEDKGRATFNHLRDYLRHAQMVRDLFLATRSDAWHHGFARLLLPEIRSMVREWQMTSREREWADAEMKRIFERPRADTAARSHRMLLFMYNVCGLGGVEASITNKMEALRPLGVDVRALFECPWGEGGGITGRHRGVVIEADTEAQRRLIRDWSPDAIIVIDSPWLIDVVSGAGVDCPILFETHVSDPEALGRRVLPGASDPRVSAVIAPSMFNRTVLAEHGIDPARVRLVPNPIDLGRFRSGLDTDILVRLGVPSGRRVILFVGRLEPAKNPLEFVRVAVELARHDPDLHCIVVGDAVDTKALANAVHSEADALAGRVTFVPRVLPEDMPLLYNGVARTGGILVSTSVCESQPMVILEAMACGCPVLASDVGGVREIVRDGQTGHLYRLGDLQGAVVAARQLMDEPDHREAVVLAATAYVQTSHTLARAAEACVALLDEVGARSGHDGAPGQETRPNARAGGPLEATRTTSLAQNLTRFFTEKVLVGVRRTVTPYRDLVPGVQLGFEPSATVELEMRPKDDFSRSPDQCLNTLVLDYKGPSRWLTIECAFDRAELMGAEQFQIGVYARPRWPLPCQIVLRIPTGDAAFDDVHLCDLTLAPEGRSAHGRGRLGLPATAILDERHPPKLLFFLGAGTDLHLELDYLTAYLA